MGPVRVEASPVSARRRARRGCLGRPSVRAAARRRAGILPATGRAHATRANRGAEGRDPPDGPGPRSGRPDLHPGRPSCPWAGVGQPRPASSATPWLADRRQRWPSRVSSTATPWPPARRAAGRSRPVAAARAAARASSSGGRSGRDRRRIGQDAEHLSRSRSSVERARRVRRRQRAAARSAGSGRGQGRTHGQRRRDVQVVVERLAERARAAASSAAGSVGSSGPILAIRVERRDARIQPVEAAAAARERLVGVVERGPVVDRDER